MKERLLFLYLTKWRWRWGEGGVGYGGGRQIAEDDINYDISKSLCLIAFGERCACHEYGVAMISGNIFQCVLTLLFNARKSRRKNSLSFSVHSRHVDRLARGMTEHRHVGAK